MGFLAEKLMRIIENTIYFDFTTHNPSTGAVSDADSTPTCEVFKDDNDTALISPIVTKRVGKTGDYRLPVVATSANGFEVGKSYNVIVSATVNGILAKARVGSFTLANAIAADVWDAEISGHTGIEAGKVIDDIKKKANMIPGLY
jgi:hypothetical protein